MVPISIHSINTCAIKIHNGKQCIYILYYPAVGILSWLSLRGSRGGKSLSF